MTKSVRFTWIGVIALILVVVLAVSFIGKITGGFTKDLDDVTLRDRNPENLLSGDYGWTDNKRNMGDGIVLTSKKDGTIILDGEYKGSEQSVTIDLETVSLSAGTYTVSGAPKGGSYTYHLLISYSSGTCTADFGDANGTFTLTSPESVELKLVCFAENSFDSIKIQPVLVEGSEAGDFYE